LNCIVQHLKTSTNLEFDKPNFLSKDQITLINLQFFGWVGFEMRFIITNGGALEIAAITLHGPKSPFGWTWWKFELDLGGILWVPANTSRSEVGFNIFTSQ
jgi:hypothetical protein